MEVFSGVRERSKTYDVARLTDNILYPPDEIQKLLDFVNKRVMICHSGMDELNPMEKLAIEVLQNANDMAY